MDGRDTRDILDRHRVLRLLLGLVTVLVAMWVLGVVWSVLASVGDILLLFFLAWVITFVLAPVSNFLISRKFPRVLAVSLVYIALLVVISGAIVLMVPAIQSQVTQLAEEIKSDLSAERLAALNASAVDLLRRLGFTANAAQHIVSQISQQVPGWAGSLANNAVNFATTLVTSIMTILFDTALVFIISFYMMLDGERLVKSIVAKLPPRWKPDVRMFQRQVNETFGGFFRAQIIIALIYGLFTWLVLIGLGEPNGFLASLLAGLIMMIPFIGSFGAFVPPLLLVLLQTPNDQLIGKIVVLVLLLIVAQQIALQLIAPRVFGKTLGINPLILFAALLLGAKWGGVWGAFFAGPIVAVFAAVGEIFYDRYTRKLPLFQPGEETEDTAEEASAEPVNATVVSRNGDVTVSEGNGQHPVESAPEQERATPRH
ncbi:MAG TPA: AI-2E family transporter [Ktedonobacterales bacterium]|nr:AI-2E family transporter [Ktedonobacterales bacterium]